MGKNTNFTGQPLYAQIIKLIDKSNVQRISLKGGHERYVKKFDGWTHLVVFLFAVLKHYDSLREMVIGLMSEANKLHHLGISYVARRSTLSEANNRRSSSFFESIYYSLYRKYKSSLTDSIHNYAWERCLHIMDSTTITLFSDILKGAGRNPRHGKKKGGIKAHTVMKYDEAVPYLVRYTSAATHDHFMLKILQLPKGSFLAIDRAYIDYAKFEEMTRNGVFYVIKMKRNLTFRTQRSHYTVNAEGLVVCHEAIVEFVKDEIRHKSRKIEWWDAEKKKSVTLLTNNFELPAEEIVEIYRRRWEIELIFKQLKQNFPLKYFYGDSVNAIKSQIWVTLIANLLISVVKHNVKRSWSFSNLTAMINQMLMYYIDLYRYLENPERECEKFMHMSERSPNQLSLF